MGPEMGRVPAGAGRLRSSGKSARADGRAVPGRERNARPPPAARCHPARPRAGGSAPLASRVTPGPARRSFDSGHLIQTVAPPAPVLEGRVEVRLDALPQRRGHDWSALDQIRDRFR